jgi:hypothetical protein
VVFDAGRRKSFLWRRLTTPAGDPGSLTFWHATGSRHRLISEHVTSEKGTQVSGPWGEMTVWQLIPGRPNHWLDCLSGCATAESMCGGRLADGPLTAPAPAGSSPTGPTRPTRQTEKLGATGTGPPKSAAAAATRGPTSPRRSARGRVSYL